MSCAIWINTSILWSNANWQWSQCSGSIIPLVNIGIPVGVDASLLSPSIIDEPWNPYKNIEKKKKRISLLCKVGETKYEKEKDVNDFNVKVNSVKTSIKINESIDVSIGQ